MNARTVKLIRGCVALFILVAVYSISQFTWSVAQMNWHNLQSTAQGWSSNDNLVLSKIINDNYSHILKEWEKFLNYWIVSKMLLLSSLPVDHRSFEKGSNLQPIGLRIFSTKPLKVRNVVTPKTIWWCQYISWWLNVQKTSGTLHFATMVFCPS